VVLVVIARKLLIAHVATTAIGAAALWWLVTPKSIWEAAVDGITAAALAAYAEIMGIRFGL
jgi:hypothetical protein